MELGAPPISLNRWVSTASCMLSVTCATSGSTRHNQSACRKAKNWSGGRYRRYLRTRILAGCSVLPRRSRQRQTFYFANRISLNLEHTPLSAQLGTNFVQPDDVPKSILVLQAELKSAS